MSFIVSILLKIIIYSLWCFIAIKHLAPKDHKIHHANPFISSLKFGVIRIIVGLMIGFLLWSLAIHIFPAHSNRLGISLSAAILTMICIHAINWSITLRLMMGQLLLKKNEISWIFGGTVISFLMDIILFVGFQLTFAIC